MVDEIEFLELLADVLEIEPEDISLLTDYRTEIELCGWKGWRFSQVDLSKIVICIWNRYFQR